MAADTAARKERARVAAERELLAKLRDRPESYFATGHLSQEAARRVQKLARDAEHDRIMAATAHHEWKMQNYPASKVDAFVKVTKNRVRQHQLLQHAPDALWTAFGTPSFEAQRLKLLHLFSPETRVEIAQARSIPSNMNTRYAIYSHLCTLAHAGSPNEG